MAAHLKPLSTQRGSHGYIQLCFHPTDTPRLSLAQQQTNKQTSKNNHNLVRVAIVSCWWKNSPGTSGRWTYQVHGHLQSIRKVSLLVVPVTPLHLKYSQTLITSSEATKFFRSPDLQCPAYISTPFSGIKIQNKDVISILGEERVRFESILVQKVPFSYCRSTFPFLGAPEARNIFHHW